MSTLEIVAATALRDYGAHCLHYIAKSLGRKIPPKELRDNVLCVLPTFGLPECDIFPECRHKAVSKTSGKTNGIEREARPDD